MPEKTSRLHRVADQLLLIERALREMDCWGDVLPDEAALSSELPFCVDTLLFEEWLQWILLPRLAGLIESNAELPRHSNILAMAEEIYRDQLECNRVLLDALGELDRLLTAPGS